VTDAATQFRKLFEDMEHALKRAGFKKPNQDYAEADWNAFARHLGKNFFLEVQSCGKAADLLQERPRKLTKDLQWGPKQPVPINSVIELFENGVCRVRNNLVHGEKYKGLPKVQQRDEVLVVQSKWVLELALAKSPDLQKHF